MCERMYAFDPKRTPERWFGPAGWTQLPPISLVHPGTWTNPR